MKKISLYIIGTCISGACTAQLPGAPDTIFPKKSSLDTVKNEPKLQGGALIDTINVKKDNYVPHSGDTIRKRPKMEGDRNKNE